MHNFPYFFFKFSKLRFCRRGCFSGNRSLYPRLGYSETGRRMEDGFDRVFYRKELS